MVVEPISTDTLALGNNVPLKVKPANVGLADVCKFCAGAIVIVEPDAVAVKPFVPVKLNDCVANATAPADPLEPAVFYVAATEAVPSAVIRPYKSVVMTGIAVLLPTVPTPGP